MGSDVCAREGRDPWAFVVKLSVENESESRKSLRGIVYELKRAVKGQI